MKNTLRITLCLLAAGLLARGADGEAFPFRTWTAQNGSTVEAQFVRQRGATLTLNRKAEAPLRIQLRDLSTDDQEYVREILATQENALQNKRAAFLNKKTVEKPAVKVSSKFPQYLTEKEWAVIQETSLARRDPKAYADFIRQYRQRHQGGNDFSTPRGILTTREGVSAVDEAIAFLENQEPLKGLSPSLGLTRAARDHADDMGKAGRVGHTGTDRSSSLERVERHGRWQEQTGENCQYGSGTARDIVMQLIIDDGVPDRGHRKNIFNGNFKVAGVAIRPHTRYTSNCVIVYAGGFSD